MEFKISSELPWGWSVLQIALVASKRVVALKEKCSREFASCRPWLWSCFPWRAASRAPAILPRLHVFYNRTNYITPAPIPRNTLSSPSLILIHITTTTRGKRIFLHLDISSLVIPSNYNINLNSHTWPSKISNKY